jgi:hypothetical protein
VLLLALIKLLSETVKYGLPVTGQLQVPGRWHRSLVTIT